MSFPCDNASVRQCQLSHLQNQRLRYEILSYLTRPVVAISLSAVIAITGLCIPATSLLLLVARKFFAIFGGGMLGFSIQHTLNGRMSTWSDNYDTLSKLANQLIHIEVTRYLPRTWINPR